MGLVNTNNNKSTSSVIWKHELVFELRQVDLNALSFFSMNKSEHVRKTSVVFHPIGLGTSVIKDFNPRHDIYVTKDQTWTMMDLLSIMEKLGHKNVSLEV